MIKKITALILCFLFLSINCFAGFGYKIVNNSSMAVTTPAATLIGYWVMNDNAANTTVLATVGINSTLSGDNTETVQTGTGFNLVENADHVYNSYLEAYLWDSFTIQGDFLSPTTGVHSTGCYLMHNNLGFALRYEFGGVSGRFTLYMNNVSQGNGAATYDLDINEYRTIRVVYDNVADTVDMYIGADENNLSLINTWASVPTPTDAQTGTYTTIGEGWAEEISHFKFWEGVEAP